MQEQRLTFPGQSRIRRSWLANGLVGLASIGLVMWSLRTLQERFTSVISVDAVVNAPITDLKAPQAGKLEALNTETGAPVRQGEVVLQLENDRVDKLTVQAATSQKVRQQADLAAAQVRLEQLRSQQQTLQAEASSQFTLENSAAQASADQVQAELDDQRAALTLAQTNYRRAASLAAEGALARAEVDQAQAELDQARARLSALENRLVRSQVSQEAAAVGLSLDRTRSGFDPRIRLQELALQIAEQEQQVASLTVALTATEAEVSEAAQDFDRKQTARIEAPTDGVVWQMTARPGEYVEQGEVLGQVVDCQQRWVDAYVSERNVRLLQPGTPAQIALYGTDSQVLSGKISQVRSGVGRLAPGQEVAVPLERNLPRATQVRVELTSDDAPPASFCYVGYTGRVTFDLG
ncbi:MAG: HlyD family efflux transporter periplasmic adaptor subunit [Cyanobacteria bacterium P01_A01_bin.17]